MRIYEFSQDPRNFYLITEYCEGGELGNKVMKAKCFSEFTVSKLMKQILSAVAYCHSRHIVHRYFYIYYRDLKLENIVMETDDINGTAKIIDFGTCKIFRRKESMKEFIGSVFNLIK